MIETPTTQERYLTAIHSSSLRVEAAWSGDADYLIAAGWGKYRFGSALMRLHSEWDAAARRGCRIPRQATRKQIAALAQHFSRQEGAEKVTQAHSEKARQSLAEKFELELRETMCALKSLPSVRLHLSIKAAMEEVADAEAMSALLLLHWLQPGCPVCCGRRFQLQPWTDVLSNKPCGGCGGSGCAPAPGGEKGKALLNYLDDCVNVARQAIKKRIQTFA
ncbi:hypothetical protein [Comamonas sp. GB3 AK4-5]|uniref:hypothetical protein n=1 Tax=Comamonas sp. GB3 AK4-5 TaxID=3231487 RepID=UPI00351F6BB0